MTIMLLSGVPEISGIVTEHERYSSRHCRYAGSITGFRYERCETFAYLDSPLYFQAVRDDSYGFTSWCFKFYQTSRYNYPIWKMCVTPNYDKVATYDGGSVEEQESMRDCLTEAFSIYYRYTLTSENNRPCIWDNAHAMFKEKVLYSTRHLSMSNYICEAEMASKRCSTRSQIFCAILIQTYTALLPISPLDDITETGLAAACYPRAAQS